MLQRNGKDSTTHGFMIAVEIEDGTNIEHIADKLGEGIMWVEGVGAVDVHHLGEVDVIVGQVEDELDDDFLKGEVRVGKADLN